MMRSLFAGVSGIKSHQTRMDVIGNNIANINTIGFKAGRAVFAQAIAQTVRGATRPYDGQGGTNPMQVGLGVQMGSVDTIFTQGNLESTGVKTDMAIQGNGFFVLSDGSNEYYTRAGNFQFDADGRLVNPTTGYVVQGMLADSNGEIKPGTPIGDLILPFGQKVAAKATTKVEFTGNLNADVKPVGTILKSNVMFAIEKAGSNSDVNGLYAKGVSNSVMSGITPGATTVTVSDGTTTKVYTYAQKDTGAGNGDFHSLDDLVAEINNDFGTEFTATLTNDGSIQVAGVSGAGDTTVSFSSNNASLNAALAAADGTVNASTTTSTDKFSHKATKDDLLTDLLNSVGDTLNLASGDQIDLSVMKNGELVSGNFTVAADSKLSDLLTTINTVFQIQNDTGAYIDDGALTVKGDPGEENTLQAISIREGDNEALNSIMSFAEMQAAKDATHTANITVYDAMGQKHTMIMEFKKTDIRNQWTWNITFKGDEIVSSGGKGKISFNSDGSIASFTYSDGANSLQFDPNNGSVPVNIKLDLGRFGEFNGLTQFSSPSAMVTKSQDGYASGNLSSISINGHGEITGLFTNGVTQKLGQLVLASFNNPSGLTNVGNNLYMTSANSGTPVTGKAGEIIQAEILPGYLEMSNVDLAQEFTNMIVAQRGFQANARVITTSDQMLNEMVNIKR
ncbi:MAG: flagellar hook-basal body complex protein [Calditrichaeota bacterium]|nr:flagellar hook-basal body complex protein [Calditrichota bacterium]